MIKAILLAAGQSKRLKGQNKLIKKVENINLNEEINIQFQDGLASAKIKSKESSND